MTVKCCSAHICDAACDHKEDHEPTIDNCDLVKVACKFPAICIPTDSSNADKQFTDIT